MNRNLTSAETAGNGRHDGAPPGHAADASGRISTEAAPRTGRLLAFAAGGLALLLAIAFVVAFAVHHRSETIAEHQASDAQNVKPAVDVVSVRQTPGHYPLTLPGQTAGWYQSTIYARVDGYIGSWSADIGDRVKQGQVLATIDTPELDQQLAASKAKAAASDAQVDVAQSDVSISKLTYDRWRDSPKGVVSEQEREEKKAQYTAAVAHLAEAKAQAQLDEADVGRYAALESFRKVTAPYDGIITGRHVDVGDLVTLGSSANTTPLYSVAQSNVIRCFVDVPQKATADTVVGLPAHATTDEEAGRRFSGKIARTAMSIDPQTRTERVEVDVPNPDLVLVPGMYVQVTFELNQAGLLEVPAAAILYRPDGLKVAVVGANGNVDIRPVTIAKDDGDTVELAAGVTAGEKVALNISSAITPGEQVTAVDDDANAPTPPPPPPSPAPAVQTTSSFTTPPPANTPVPAETSVHPPDPGESPAPGPSGPGRTAEPTPTLSNHAPLDKPAGGTGAPRGPIDSHPHCCEGYEMKIRSLELAAAAAGVALFAGCSAGPDYRRPALATGPAFTTARATTRPASTQAVSRAQFEPGELARWWEVLDDAELNTLLDRATGANLDLQIAVTRLQQARAIESVYYGGALPSLNFSAVLGQGTGTSVTRSGQLDGPLNDASDATGLREITHALGVDTSFEIDVFGDLRREEQAVSADAAAAGEFRNQVLVTLLGDVARRYVQVRTLQLRLDLAVSAVGAQRQSAHVAHERFDRGITNELDVALADREVETTQAILAPIRAQLLGAERDLAVLLGEEPDQLLDELRASSSLPKPPAEINPGLPGDLLRRRPDVRQAEAQLIAANARLGVATAHLYPRLWLSAAVGEEGQGLGREPVAWRNIWEAAPSLSVPLLDFGQTDAVIQGQNQATRGAVAHYQLTVLQAVEEVDNGLTDYDAERSRLDNLRRAVADARRAYDLANQRYDRGIVDFLNVLDAERELYALQDQYAVSEEASVTDFVNVCQSLGGGWEGFAPPPPLHAPLPALLAGFRDATGHSDRPD